MRFLTPVEIARLAEVLASLPRLGPGRRLWRAAHRRAGRATTRARRPGPIREAATNVEPYVRADGTRIWSLMQLERQLWPEAYGRRRGGYVDRRHIRPPIHKPSRAPAGEPPCSMFANCSSLPDNNAVPTGARSLRYGGTP